MVNRPLPGNVEQEQALLGALMIQNDAINQIPLLEPKHFAETLHGNIFQIIQDLTNKNRVANPVTIKSILPDQIMGEGLTTSQYLARLAAEAVNIVNVPDFARGIMLEWCRRNLISAGDACLDVGYDITDETQLSEEIEALAGMLDESLATLAGGEDTTGMEVADSYAATITPGDEGHPTEGVPLCLPELEAVLSDKLMRAGRLYGFLSSSGEGKTSLVLQQIHHALKKGHPVLFLSYDQGWKECVVQMAAQQLGIEARRQWQRDLSDTEAERCIGFAYDLGNKPFQVMDCTTESAPRLGAYMRRWVKKLRPKKTPLIVIDHIGVVTPEDSRADAGSKARQIAQAFKAYAKELDAAILVLQQRSSFGMKRANPRPTPMDLYGGESARQPFDTIFYLFRVEKHRTYQLSIASTASERSRIEELWPLAVWEGKAEIGALKVRQADETIRRKVEWEGRFTRYKSMQTEELPL